MNPLPALVALDPHGVSTDGCLGGGSLFLSLPGLAMARGAVGGQARDDCDWLGVRVVGQLHREAAAWQAKRRRSSVSGQGDSIGPEFVGGGSGIRANGMLVI